MLTVGGNADIRDDLMPIYWVGEKPDIILSSRTYFYSYFYPFSTFH